MKTNTIWGIFSPLSLEENHFRMDLQQHYELLKAKYKALNAHRGKQKTQVPVPPMESHLRLKAWGGISNKALVLFH